MSNQLFDLLMKDLETEIRRVYDSNTRPALYGGGFLHGYMFTFFLSLIKELPDPVREKVIDDIVDRVIFLRSREPEVPVTITIIEGEAS